MKVISTETAPAAIGPYSQAIVTNGLVFASGQIPVDPATGAPAGDTIDTQAEQSCKNVAAILAAAGSDMTKVVKTNGIYSKYFEKDCPARSCVAAKALPKGVLCEIEAIAEL